MTEQQRQHILDRYFDLETYMQEYRKALLWLTHGNHKTTPHPTKQETQQIIQTIQEKITSLLTEIDASINV